MDYLNIPELDETAVALVTIFLQAKNDERSSEEVYESVKVLSDDLTIDEFQTLTYLLASLSADLVENWAASTSSEVATVWQTIALAKADQRGS